MTALGVDFGSKMIGIAVGDADHGITTARAPIKASGTLLKDAKALAQIAQEEQAEIVVLGIPVNLPGKSDRMQKVCEQLAVRLRELGVKVELVNEALTSLEAQTLEPQTPGNAARGAGFSLRSSKRTTHNVHSRAARLILERYFARQ